MAWEKEGVYIWEGRKVGREEKREGWDRERGKGELKEVGMEGLEGREEEGRDEWGTEGSRGKEGRRERKRLEGRE